MKISKTRLNGVLQIRLKPFNDLRGTYLEIFNKKLFKNTKKKVNFIQDDISISRRNVLRGIHGDFKTWKLVTCLMGEFLLLVVNNKKKINNLKNGKYLSFLIKTIYKYLFLLVLEMRITLSQRKQYFTISNRHCTIVSLNLQLIGETKILNLNGPKK